MCDKVLKDNITWKNSQTKIIDELLSAFQVEEIIFIPTRLDDFIGHADGMIRFIDDDNVIINDLKNEDEDFKIDFISVLKDSKLDYSEIPYNISNAKNDWDARGIYINYLQMKDIIFVPMFDFKEEDDLAEQTLSKLF
jgi:agmatine deiminase